MNLDTLDALSVALAVTLFSLYAMATSFAAATLFYAFYKERKLRVPSALPVLNLSASGFLLGPISGLFTLLIDVLQVNIHDKSSHVLWDVKCFTEEFSISVYFQALFFISALRYGLALCGNRLCRASTRQIAVSICITWVISLIYAALVTFHQQHGRCLLRTYPRGLAAAKFTFLGFLHFGATCIYANLAFYFHQKRDNLPPDFYSLDSSSRRIAERNARVSLKNIQMIALIVGTLSACNFPYVGCTVAVMFTGQLSNNVKLLAYVTMQCGIFINLILYGYLNKRFKRIVRPMLHRWIGRITNNRRKGKLNESFPQNNLSISSSRIGSNSFRDNYELTRSKLALLYR